MLLCICCMALPLLRPLWQALLGFLLLNALWEVLLQGLDKP
jgi:hypothetical protein